MMSLFSIFTRWLRARPSEFWFVLGLLALAGLAAAWNMFKFPYFENDEATYVSQAWSFIHTGQLAPYTYTYDHAPAGWMFLGIWYFVTGGLTTFGHNPLISGRIFIFILHMLSVLLLYIITKRISHLRLAAYIAVIVFAFSPLELYFGRRILLDNIMVFWVLLSIYFATKPNLRLSHVILSALALAVAVLTKENAVFLMPAVMYIVWIHTRERIRGWALAKWIAVASSVIVLYPLYAFLHGEIFPSGTLLGGTSPHVSLITTTLQQASRGRLALPWDHSSYFYVNLMEWVQRDTILIVFGALCLVATLILSNRYKEMKAIAWTTVAAILFLARGKLIIDFYIIGILPLLAIVIGNFAAQPIVWAKEHINSRNYGMLIAFILFLGFVGSGTKAFTVDETTNQQNAIAWIEKNVPNKNTYIVIDNYAYPQLHDVDGYKNADFSFKVQDDPAILTTKYHNDWHKAQYLLITHEEIVQMYSHQLSFVQKAFDNSQVVADYRNNTSSYINIQKLISTNGDWSQVYKVDPANANTLTNTWRAYKQNFVKDSGQIVDPIASATTSEGQSYGMLRATDQNDKVAFDTIWGWTQKYTQHKKDSLFSWQVIIDQQGNNHFYDVNTATDGDQDIAKALLIAQSKWGGTVYEKEAKRVISDIWNKEVANRNGIDYLLSAETGSASANLLINPSYLAPGNYAMFAKVDPSHDWNKLASDSLDLLTQAQALSPVGLISNWIAISPTGKIVPTSGFNVSDPNNFGYDAFRISWRMAAYKSDPKAAQILNTLAVFYKTQLTSNGDIFASYDMHGVATSPFSDVAPSSGAVFALNAIGDRVTSLKVYNLDIASKFNSSGHYWEQSYNYYNQNWGWFAEQELKLK
jgi:endo-1,4-beta-D-glucanase Y/4-amino-4-deoxy-L-arabinose transferase-like glycosyltransferase